MKQKNLRCTLSTLLLFSMLPGMNSTWAGVAGFKLEQFTDNVRDRPILIDWWYPVAEQEAPAYNYGFGRGHVVEAGELLPGVYPLILLSHGAMGSARNYTWLAEALARNGYLVAGISHYGESYVYGPETVDPSAVLKVWDRPEDISAALTHILTSSPFQQAVDVSRVGFAGHSSGGATALSLAGYRLNSARLSAYCDSEVAGADRGCDYGATITAELQAQIEQHSDEDFADTRIRAFVAMDPALGPGFSTGPGPTPAMLIIGSTDNDFLPFDHHAGRIAGLDDGVQTHWLSDGEGHFVYLDECSLDVSANGVSLCRDRDAVVRSAVHESLQPLILEFFTASLQD